MCLKRGNIKERGVKLREPGELGQEKTIRLEINIKADIGLVGFPNAGKSTLIASITRSQPKIASYQFTTLNPNLGMVRYIDNKNVTIVDIPGLIEGASKNRGLGHSFLNHCKLNKVIAYVIDMSLSGDIAPWDQYKLLKQELLDYDPSYAEKEELIIGTKRDMDGAKANKDGFELITGKKVILISS